MKQFSDRTKRGIKPQKDRNIVRAKIIALRFNDYETKAIQAYINKHHPKTSISQVLRHIIFKTIELPTPTNKVP